MAHATQTDFTARHDAITDAQRTDLGMRSIATGVKHAIDDAERRREIRRQRIRPDRVIDRRMLRGDQFRIHAEFTQAQVARNKACIGEWRPLDIHSP